MTCVDYCSTPPSACNLHPCGMLHPVPLTHGSNCSEVTLKHGSRCQSECCADALHWRAVIPATVVAAASFDDAIAITGYTLFINLAVRSGGSPVWSVMHGPLSLLFGVLAGILAGFMCSITKLWDNSFKRTLIMFFTSAPPHCAC